MNKKCQLAFAILLVVIAGCSSGGGNDTTGPGTGTGTGTGTGNDGTCGDGGVICVLGSSFNPVSVTIAKGGNVTFTPKTGVEHNIVFDAPFATGVNDIGVFSSTSVTRSFNDTGTFPFHCTIHAGMTGSVKVQ